MRNIKKCTNLHIRNSSFILTLVPMFLIISSSEYPAFISGIQNKEMALIADAVAQLKEKNNRGDSSGYHADVHASEIPSSTPSPTPTTSAPPLLKSADTVNNNKDITSQAALSSLSARPTNNIVNTNSFYDVVFLAASSGAIKTIQVTFPAGTTVPSGAFFNEAEKCVPGNDCTELTGTASKSGQTITYTVTNAVNVPAGTKIRLEFANINNPLNPSASYQVTVTTRDAANAIIDGPTQSTAYTMKQIGANAIATNAITSPKLSLDLVPIIWEDSANQEILYSRNTVSIPTSNIDTYTPVVDISNSGGNSLSAAIAASGNNVYVVWRDDTPGNIEILYRRSTNGGASFGNTINLSNNAGASTSPAVVASGNNVYVVWHDNTPSNFEILYRRSTDGGASFGASINLSNNAGDSFDPAIAVSGNSVYVVWQDITPGNSEILYKRSTNSGSTFGSAVNLSNNAGVTIEPDIAASGNNVYVVWNDNTPGNSEIFYRRSTDGGVSFGATDNLSNNAGSSANPSISTSGENVYLVWSDNTSGNNEISYRRSTNGGASFGTTVDLTHHAGDSITPVLAASGNNIYVVWSDLMTTQRDIFYRKSIDGGVQFSDTVNVSNDVNPSIDPAIAAI